MAIVNPWYSIREGTEVYHNNTTCTEGNNIEPYNVERGKGNKRQCEKCKELESFQNMQSLFGFKLGMQNGLLGAMKKKS